MINSKYVCQIEIKRKTEILKIFFSIQEYNLILNFKFTPRI